MIQPRVPVAEGAVGTHYDELSEYYLRIWGEHVHHGLWERGDESPEEAVRNLVMALIRKAGIGRGWRICDIGCGYGGTARMLADEYDAQVTGFTVSRAQYEFACARSNAGNPRYLLRDWMDNGLPDASFDAAISIESSEHMRDKPGFFREACRVLRPGGVLAVCAWLARDNPRPWEVKHLLEPICHEGRLPGLGTETDYLRLFSDAGFTDVTFTDFSRNVRRTWNIVVWRLGSVLLRDPDARRFLVHGPESRLFAKTILRIALAYRIGAVRFGLFVGYRPK